MQQRKKHRHSALRRLLEERTFARQADVVKAMRSQGFAVTQASISRDFEELGVAKLGDRYAPLSPQPQLVPQKRAVFALLEVLPVGEHLIVVKTISGGAQAVAEEIDHLDVVGLVGTVAGDNTIFVALRDDAAQKRALKALQLLRGR